MTRTTALLLVLMTCLASPGRADDEEWRKVHPERCYWIEYSYNSILEARADGRVVPRAASARPGTFWIFQPVGGDCYLISNRLLGSTRVLALRNGKLVMAARSQGADPALRVFNGGDRFVIKRPAPDDKKRIESGDLGSDPAGCLTFVLRPMQRVGAPLPSATNWYTNEGGVSGTVPRGSHLSPGALWWVVAPTLAGRASPDPHAKVLFTFRRGTVLQAEVGRGGADEVGWNATDDDGNAWMRARSQGGKPLDCWVPANSATLRPVKR